MPTERNHHTSKDTSFQFVVIPQGDTGSTRSFKASVKTIVLVGAVVVVTIMGITIATLLYTPAALLLPMSELQLRKQYGTELYAVQERMNRLSSEVLVLREYNNKLRKALGQQEISADSTITFGSASKFVEEIPKQSGDAKPIPEDHTQPQSDISQKVVYRAVNTVKEEATFRASFPIIAPAIGYISRRFQSEQEHFGIDYAGKIGSLIVAATDGYVVFSGYTIDDGNMVILSHGGGYLTIYKHNQNVLKSVGEFVQRGETIALLGNTGRTSYGPHLHFEVWKDGRPQNPNDYLIASEL